MDERIQNVYFDEKKHLYTYQGKQLKGVTQAIAKIVGKSFPDILQVQIATLYGSDVHKEVENYYNNNGTLHTQAGQWIVERINDFALQQDNKVNKVECEVMVSDFESTASKVDVVMHTDNGAYLFDIKTTKHFDREYCSLQLSCYKRMYERNYDERVLGMYVLASKSKRIFKILEQNSQKIERVFSLNKGN